MLSEKREMVTFNCPTFKVESGEVFIKECLISDAKKDSSTYTIPVGINRNVETTQQNAQANAAAEFAMQIKANNKAMDDFQEAIRSSIKKECQPGGLLWRQH